MLHLFYFTFLVSLLNSAFIDLNWDTTVGNQGTTSAYRGDTIRWTWTDDFEHTVTCKNSSEYCNYNEEGPYTGKGQQATWIIGGIEGVNYSYFCRIHPSMEGVIDVLDGTRSPTSVTLSPTKSPNTKNNSFQLFNKCKMIGFIVLIFFVSLLINM